MGIQINGQTDTVTSTTAGGSVTVTPLAASSGLNVGTGASISSPATNVLTLGTNNTEKVRILSSGSVGVGTTNPDIDGLNGGPTLRVSGSGAGVVIHDTTSSGRYALLARTSSQELFRIWDVQRSANRLVIDTNGSIGIGETNSPSAKLQIISSSGGDTSGLRITRTDSGGGDWRIWSTSSVNGEGAGKLIVGNSGNRVIIDSSGNIGVNSTSPAAKLDIIGDSSQQLQVTGTEADIWMKSTGPGKIWRVLGSTGGGTHRFRIYDQTASADRLNITDTGDLLLCTTSTGAQIEIDTDNTYAGGDAGCGIRLMHTSTSLGNNNALLGLNCATTNTISYRMMQLNSGTTRSSFGDAEFVFYGNGTANADGSWVGGGADYAEYFEWSDGNINDEDRRGISVVLDSNKIREALVGEDPIGVISGNPSMVGDAAWNKWSGKYLRDDYGSYVRDEDGYRQLNPDFNPDEEYIPRDQRPEWDCVGLMGKLCIRKGQVTGSRWIKMRDVSDNVEEWLVR